MLQWGHGLEGRGDSKAAAIAHARHENTPSRQRGVYPDVRVVYMYKPMALRYADVAKAQEPWEMTRDEYFAALANANASHILPATKYTFWSDYGRTLPEPTGDVSTLNMPVVVGDARGHSALKAMGNVRDAKDRVLWAVADALDQKNWRHAASALRDGSKPLLRFAEYMKAIEEFGRRGIGAAEWAADAKKAASVWFDNLVAELKANRMVPPDEHRYIVAGALARGKPVPPEVLADYPDLAGAQVGEAPNPVVAAKGEKPSAKTGLTKTQAAYLTDRLEDVVRSKPPAASGPVRVGEFVDTPEGRGVLVGVEGEMARVRKPTIGSLLSEGPPYREVPLAEVKRVQGAFEPQVIKVPGDGTFTVQTKAQAENLYRRVAGKPMPGTAEAAAKAAQPKLGKEEVVSARRGGGDRNEPSRWADQVVRAVTIPGFEDVPAVAYRGGPHQEWAVLDRRAGLAIPVSATTNEQDLADVLSAVGQAIAKIGREKYEKLVADAVAKSGPPPAPKMTPRLLRAAEKAGRYGEDVVEVVTPEKPAVVPEAVKPGGPGGVPFGIGEQVEGIITGRKGAVAEHMDGHVRVKWADGTTEVVPESTVRRVGKVAAAEKPDKAALTELVKQREQARRAKATQAGSKEAGEVPLDTIPPAPSSPSPEAIARASKHLSGKMHDDSGAVSLEALGALADVGRVVYQKTTDFAKWSAEMVRHLGERVRPYLQAAWEHMQAMLKDEGGQWRIGRVMTKRQSEQTAAKIARAAEALGYEVTESGSGVSASRYLTLYREGDEWPLEVRISDHEQRPSYRRDVGFEVGEHSEANGDWLACVKWLARKADKPLPAYLRRVVSAQERRAQEAAARTAAAMPEPWHAADFLGDYMGKRPAGVPKAEWRKGAEAAWRERYQTAGKAPPPPTSIDSTSQGPAKLKPAPGASGRASAGTRHPAAHLLSDESGRLRLPAAPDPSADIISRNEKGYSRPWTLERLQTELVDRNAPVQRAERELTGGAKVPLTESPSARLAALPGVSGKAEAWIENGVTDAAGRKVDAGLYDVLRPVRNRLREFSDYATFRHGLDVIAKKGPQAVPFDEARARAAVAAAPKEFAAALRGLVRYQDHLLDELVNAGLLSAEAKAAMRAEWPNHVPFYRQIEKPQRGLGRKMAGAANPIRRLKGSGLRIIDPLESIIKDTHVMLSLAERARAMNALADMGDARPGNGIVERVKLPPRQVAKVSLRELLDAAERQDAQSAGLDLDALTAVFRPEGLPAGKNIVRVFRHGKPEYYELEPELYRAVTAMDNVSLGLLGDILSAPAALLRAGATSLNPEFPLRNIWRDAVTALTYSKYGLKPWDLAAGLYHVARKDDLYRQWQASGGAHGAIQSIDRNYMQQSLRRLYRDTPGAGIINVAAHPIEALRALGEFSEQMARLAEFHKGVGGKVTADPNRALEAALASRDITLDFSRGGNTTRSANRFVAFLNAQVQDYSKLSRAFRERPARTTANALAYITVPTVALYLLNRNNKRYQELPEWRKDMFWFLPVNPADPNSRLVMVPKPFSLGVVFGALPERALRWADQRDPHAWDEFVASAWGQTAPNLTPTLFVPIMQWASNRDFAGAPIVPREEQDLPAELQAGPSTTALSKFVGEKLHLSPRQLDAAIQGYTGGLGRQALQSGSAALQRAKLLPPGPPPVDQGLSGVPLVRGAIPNDLTPPVQVDRFYDALTDLKHRKALAEAGRGKFTEDDQARLDTLEWGQKVLSGIRKTRRQVEENMGMTPQEKRAAVLKLRRRQVELLGGTMSQSVADAYYGIATGRRR